jgi:ParB-like nuclease domain
MATLVRNRIIGYQVIPKTDLVLHSSHVWEHPEEEKQRLAKVIDERGNTSVLLVRKLATGKYEILDGKMRFENIALQEYSCILCDLTDAEAEAETREHNILGHQSITTDPSLLARMKSVSGNIPNAENLLRNVPQIDPTNGATKTDGTTGEKPLPQGIKEVKQTPTGSHIYVFIVLPVGQFPNVQQHIAALESNASITVQRTGEEAVKT